MRSPTKRLARVFCGLSFLIGAFTAEPALRAEVSVAPEVSAGALLGVHLPEMSVRPTVGVGATCWWKPTSRLDLGIQGTLTVTSIPYGNDDGEPIVGKRGNYNSLPPDLQEDITVMPRLAVAWRYALWDAIALRGFLGATFLVSGAMKRFAIFPFPTAGIAVETKLGHSLRLRAGAEYILVPFHSDRGMVGPSVGFGWN